MDVILHNSALPAPLILSRLLSWIEFLRARQPPTSPSEFDGENPESNRNHDECGSGKNKKSDPTQKDGRSDQRDDQSTNGVPSTLDAITGRARDKPAATFHRGAQSIPGRVHAERSAGRCGQTMHS